MIDPSEKEAGGSFGHIPSQGDSWSYFAPDEDDMVFTYDQPVSLDETSWAAVVHDDGIFEYSAPRHAQAQDPLLDCDQPTIIKRDPNEPNS